MTFKTLAVLILCCFQVNFKRNVPSYFSNESGKMLLVYNCLDFSTWINIVDTKQLTNDFIKNRLHQFLHNTAITTKNSFWIEQNSSTWLNVVCFIAVWAIIEYKKIIYMKYLKIQICNIYHQFYINRFRCLEGRWNKLL